MQQTLKLKKNGQGLYETTRSVNAWIADQDIDMGMLTDFSLNNPVAVGRQLLGTWLGICLFDHCPIPDRRKLVHHLSGE